MNGVTCSYIEYELFYSNAMQTNVKELAHYCIEKKDILFLTNKVSTKYQKLNTSNKEREGRLLLIDARNACCIGKN